MATNCKDYDFLQIEPHWQSFWEKTKAFKAENGSTKPKYYVLDMFPYPSGSGLHIGHPEGYQEAFATIYRDAADAITAYITGIETRDPRLERGEVELGALGAGQGLLAAELAVERQEAERLRVRVEPVALACRDVVPRTLLGGEPREVALRDQRLRDPRQIPATRRLNLRRHRRVPFVRRVVGAPPRDGAACGVGGRRPRSLSAERGHPRRGRQSAPSAVTARSRSLSVIASHSASHSAHRAAIAWRLAT